MTQAGINWDNLRLFLAVVRAQSAQEAARRLDVDHSTVTRRLHRLEKELGTQLFERTPAGHVMTAAGHRLLEHVERIESTVAYLQGFTAQSFAGAAERRITQPRWNGKSLSGEEFLVQHVIPNFYFHVTTAYAILRHNGVPVGKKNYLGAMPYREAA